MRIRVGPHVWTLPHVPDGGCMRCDECDLPYQHSEPCDCGHEVRPAELLDVVAAPPATPAALIDVETVTSLPDCDGEQK